MGWLSVSAVVAALWAGTAWGAPRLVRRGFRVARRVERRDPGELGLAFRTVSVPTERGKQLFGWFIPAPDERPGPAVAVLHGWGGNAEFMLPFAPLLHSAGYSLLLFDSRCHGRSDDDDFSSMVRFAEDLEHALVWLQRQPQVLPDAVTLLGHSVGAAAALLVASRRPDVAAVVSLAAFAHPAEVMRSMMTANRIPYLPVGWWVLRHVEKAIGARYEVIAPCNTIGRVSCPVLLVHGDADRTVPVTDAAVLAARRGELPTERLIIPGADHYAVDRIRTHGPELIAFLDRATAR